MPAVVRASYYGASASEPAGVTAESGVKFNREDTQNGTTPIPIPSATGTNYSYLKQLALEVTTAVPANSLLNRRVYKSVDVVTGQYIYYKGAASYVQAAAGNQPADSVASNGAIPSTYSLMSALAIGNAHQWDGAVVAAALGRNGAFLVLVGGLGFNYAAGAGAANAGPSFVLAYDEQ